MAVRVVTDSTSYIPPDMSAGLDIRLVSLSVNLDGTSWRELDMEGGDFWRALAASGKMPTSSQPSVAEIVEAFEEPVSAGDDVVAVLLSSEMSGTFATALMAKAQVQERHPGAVIEIVDSRSNSMELGFAVLAAARAAKGGASAAESAEAARAVVARSRFLFVPATLEYLRRGGRIGGASALLGNLLQIHPILTVVDGKTDVLKRVRTKARAYQEVVDVFAADIAGKGFGGGAIVHHIDDPEAGRALAELVEKVAGRPVPVIPLGPVIGLHVGPGTAGLVYLTAQPLGKNHATQGSASGTAS
jgi:DegV family protein with EDD domain